MDQLIKSVLFRFLRAFVAGAVATMLTVVPMAANSGWKDLGTWLSALALAGIVGGVTGVLMATDKALRSN